MITSHLKFHGFPAIAALLGGILIGGPSSAHATLIFSDNFDSYVGNQNANQADTGTAVAYGGSVPGWTGTGVNALHGLEVGVGQWAIMFYYNNLITLSAGIAANDLGTAYNVTFNYGTGNYGSESQGTGALDGLTVEVLRGDNSILAQQTYMPGVWGPGNYDMQAGLLGTLSYVGDGTGDVRLVITDSNPTDSVFGGTIDNLAVNSDDSATPEPGAFLLTGLGIAGLGCFNLRRRRQPAMGPRR